jgi:hypothetical protein
MPEKRTKQTTFTELKTGESIVRWILTIYSFPPLMTHNVIVMLPKSAIVFTHFPSTYEFLIKANFKVNSHGFYTFWLT